MAGSAIVRRLRQEPCTVLVAERRELDLTRQDQGDNYHPEHSHVVAALIRRFHEAKIANASTVVVWGTGTPRREFLYVDDFADACVFVLKNYSDSQFINIGFGKDLTIAEFARTVAEVVGVR